MIALMEGAGVRGASCLETRAGTFSVLSTLPDICLLWRGLSGTRVLV